MEKNNYRKLILQRYNLDMHYIQKHILDKLRSKESMNYTALKPAEIESGHFRYHLSELVKDGYVVSFTRGKYSLTSKGQSYVDKLSEKRVNPFPMPKVITYTLLKDDDTLLLHKKPKQPYMGLLNMIGGKLHEGELASEAAMREVKEKTGVTIISPRLAGIFEILIFNDSDLFTHVIAYVFVAETSKDNFKDEAIVAIPEKEVTNVSNLAPDFLSILNKLDASHGAQTGGLLIKI